VRDGKRVEGKRTYEVERASCAGQGVGTWSVECGVKARLERDDVYLVDS